MTDSTYGTLRLKDGLLLLDAEGRVKTCNSMLCELLGWQRDRVVGRALGELDAAPLPAGLLAELLERAARAQQEVVESVPCDLPCGRRQLRIRAFAGKARTTILIEDRTAAMNLEEGLSRFVGPTLVQQVRDESLASWHAERTQMTLVGVAAAGFSYFAERLEPPALHGLLNDMVRRVVDVAEAGNAALIKLSLPQILIGLADPDHARRGVEMAIEVAAVSRALERQCALRGLGVFKLAVAVNTGMVVVGPVGCEERMEYTVLGSQVDTVTHLVEAGLAGSVSITHATRELLGGWQPADFAMLDHGPQRIFGLGRPVGVVQLVPRT
jgi:class 3 adenylate cyclase